MPFHGSFRFESDVFDQPSFASEVKNISNKKRRMWLAYTLMGAAAILILIGILYSTILPNVINEKIKNGVAYCSIKDLRESFNDPHGDCEGCAPYYVSYFPMNVTNTRAFLLQGATLKVRELGPYVYRRYTKRVNITMADNRVKYKSYTFHQFQNNMSCANCKEHDLIIGIDAGYLRVISEAGGETEFLMKLLESAPFSASLTQSQMQQIIIDSGSQILRFLNGLNSLVPSAMTLISKHIMEFMIVGPTAIAHLNLDAFNFNGLFVSRSVREWAIGYPSFVAGMALGSSHLRCQKKNFHRKCAACVNRFNSSSKCQSLRRECSRCKTAAAMVLLSEKSCKQVESRAAKIIGEAEAKSLASTTCGMCASYGLCAAPLPGAIEQSGLDWSKQPPPDQILNYHIQRTGCDDKDYIGEYEQFDGYTKYPMWVDLNSSRRNPNLDELSSFGMYANCDSPPSNLTCTKVFGGDGTSMPPALTSITGLASTLTHSSMELYLSQANQNVTLYNTKQSKVIKGITLIRLKPRNDLLNFTASDHKGVGVPYDGVLNLGFVTGFLAFLSYPVFAYGDSRLLDNVEITLRDGVVATQDSLYGDDNDLLPEYADMYTTYLDVEPTTGKTLDARKRLMASYAVSRSPLNHSSSMLDVLWPSIPTEVIYPVFWAEERPMMTNRIASSFTRMRKLAASFLPVLFISIIAGIATFIVGILLLRRAL
uniref:Croquemortlike mating protein M82 putative n=1 Tax=Albugo laibachii Nc14 TaxID=890382 RepID=F0WMM0_9STRA|nr:croquemortlike mating protein M82 putative [Albugo laibachii Nc14]|eukprot:CCA22552.1 croquemortlike mating protein M82 putative [Albugo laibachii Nc14]